MQINLEIKLTGMGPDHVPVKVEVMPVDSWSGRWLNRKTAAFVVSAYSAKGYSLPSGVVEAEDLPELLAAIGRRIVRENG